MSKYSSFKVISALSQLLSKTHFKKLGNQGSPSSVQFSRSVVSDSLRPQHCIKPERNVMPETWQHLCSYKVCVAAGWSKSDPILSSYHAQLHSRSRLPQKGWGGPRSVLCALGTSSPFRIDLRQAEHLFPASIPTVRSHLCQRACFFF